MTILTAAVPLPGVPQQFCNSPYHANPLAASPSQLVANEKNSHVKERDPSDDDDPHGLSDLPK